MEIIHSIREANTRRYKGQPIWLVNLHIHKPIDSLTFDIYDVFGHVLEGLRTIINLMMKRSPVAKLQLVERGVNCQYESFVPLREC